MRFVDTNVLLYALSTAKDETVKARIAREILEADDLALSVQVLQEFHVQATRASRRDALGWEQSTALIEAWLRFPVQEMTVALMLDSLAASRRFRISLWDAAIIEAARAQGCDRVLSEDLSDGQNYDGIKVLNPFRARGG